MNNKYISFGFTALTDTDREIQELARKFTKEEIIPAAAYHDETGEYPTEIFKKAWSLGLLNGHIPKHAGLSLFTYFNESIPDLMVYYLNV